MPKLKSALLAHQSQAARYAAEKRARENRDEVWGSGKGKKRSKLTQPGTKPLDHPRQDKAQKPNGTSGLNNSGKAQEAPKRRPTIPFDKSDTILLLGEANFSYALSLLRPPHNLHGCMICATSFDSEEVAYKKYPDAEVNVVELRAKGVRVEFGVDAGDLGKCKFVGKGKWSRVIFNFPHVGAGIKDQDRNILSNQHLVLRTLQSVRPVLTTGPPQPVVHDNKRKRKPSDNDDDEAGEEEETIDADGEADMGEDDDELHQPPPKFNPPDRQGTLLITLLDQPPYTIWNVPKLATKPPPLTPGTRTPQPRYTLLRSFEFRPEVYEGYAHRRTIGFKVGKSRDGNEEIMGRKGKARTWEFAPKPERED